MNDDLQLVRDLLPAQPPPTFEVTAASRGRLLATMTTGSPSRTSRRRSRPYWLGLPIAAGASAAAVLLATAGNPVSPGRPVAAGSGHPAPITGKPSGTSAARVPSAHALLLTAATSAARATPAPQGTYWRVQIQYMRLRLAGTAASPYEMAWLEDTDTANARAASKKSWYMDRDLGAKPATPRDQAAWRADGSPRDWLRPVAEVGGVWHFLKTPTAPRAPFITDTQLNGKVAYALGDGSWLTMSQLAAFPTDPAKLKARMIRYVNQDYRLVGGIPKGSTMDQELMGEAINLLQAPLPSAVKSAVYQVMAGLPGSRTLGIMRDPLGRTGYGVAIAATQMVKDAALPPATQGTAVLIVDPSSGQLLATEVIVTTPGTTVVHAPTGISAGSKGLCTVLGKFIMPGKASTPCVPRVYYGPRHQGQVWSSTVIKSASWTNTAP